MMMKISHIELERLNGVIATLTSQNESLVKELTAARDKTETLALRIKILECDLYGKKSEKRRREDEEIGWLFDVGEPTIPLPEVKTVEVKPHKRDIVEKKKDLEEEAPEGTFPAHLRREDVCIDEKPEGVPDEDLEIISEKVTERLATTPQQQYVKRIIRKVYKQKSTGTIITSPAPSHVLDRRCKVDETFLISMIIKKFLWHMPLYRQQQELMLQGIPLSRDRMVSWVIGLSKLYKPIVTAIKVDIIKSRIVFCDETFILVAKGKKHKDKEYAKGYLWPVLAEEIGVAFVYHPTRNNKVTHEVLKGFTGILVSDALDIYENFVKTSNNPWQICWMHIRRKFVKAKKSNKVLADEALDFIAELYRIEAEIKELPVKAKTIERQKRSKIVLNSFYLWLKEKYALPEVLTDNVMCKAFNYVKSRWEAACLFVSDGSIPIDNGASERAIRPSKLGAKNWLHCVSQEGAEAVAIFYSLIGSALMHGIDPYYYLLDLTKRLDDPKLKAADLAPHRWKERFYNEAVPEHLRYIITKGAPFIGNPSYKNLAKA